MIDEDKRRGQLINELVELRQQVTDLGSRLEQRKQAEGALRESAEKYHSIFDTAATLITSVNKEGIIVDCNNRIQQVLGYAPDEIIGQSLAKIIHPDDLTKALESLREILATGFSYNKEYKMVRKDGTLIDVIINSAALKDERGVYVRTICIIDDVTERKRAEKELQAEKNKLQAMVDAMEYGLTIQDKSYTIIYQNAILKESFCGLGEKCYRVYEGKDKPCDGCPVELAFRDGQSHTSERKVVLPSGEITFWENTANPIRDADGKIVSCLEIARDDTERKQAEEELRATVKQLEETHQRAKSDKNRLDTLLKTIPLGVVILERPDAKIAYLNDRAVELYGTDPRGLEMSNHSSKMIKLLTLDGEIYPPNKLPASRALIHEEVVRNEELMIERPDGTLITISAHAAPLFDANGIVKAAIGIFEDITERKKIEEALKQSETEYRALFEMTGHAKAIIEEDMMISRINKEFELISGYSKAEMEGKKKWSEFLAEDDVERITEYHRLRRVNQKTVPRNYEFHYRTKKGELRNGFVTVDLIPGTKKSIAAIVDITERKQAEEALRETSDYLKNLFNYANAPIIVWDPSFTITRFNRAFEHLTGRSATEVVGKPLDILFPKDKREEAMTHIRRAMAGERWETVEIPILHTDGTVRIVLWNSATLYADDGTTPIATIAQGQDITDRKYAEEALQTAHLKMRAAFDAIREPMNVVDLDFNLIEVNDALIKSFGLPDKEAVIGHKCFDALKGRKDMCPNCAVAEVYQTKSPTYRISTLEDEILTEERSFEVFAYPIMDEHEELFGAVELTRDITDRKQAEEQIKASLREKEILLREIHHRVKNNLQVISTLLYLQSRHIKDKKVLEAFTESQNRIKSMALIHDKLYQFKDLGKINIAQYIRDLTTDLFHSYGANPDGIKLKINVYEVLLDVNTAIPCGLMINELVSNALKHAFPEGMEGEIRIKLIHSVGEKTFTLIVSDNGIGFPEDLDFRKTKTLGLQLVITLVDQLNGTIEFDRRRGTEFKITFAEQ